MTLEKFFSAHYLAIKPGTNRKTIRLYKLVIRKFGQWLGRLATLSDFDDQTIGGYLAACIESGNKPATTNGERAKLLALWRLALTLGMVKRGPLVQKVKEPEIVPRALSVDELKQLTFAFDKLQGETGTVPNSLAVKAMFSTHYTTGERCGAIRQLEWSDIRGQTLIFRAEIRKGGQKALVREVPDWVIEDIEACKTPHNRCFPGMTENKCAILWNRLFKRAGISHRKGKTSHLLRSSHATYVKAAGGDATASLGHSSDATTIKSYLDPLHQNNEFWKLLPKLN